MLQHELQIPKRPACSGVWKIKNKNNNSQRDFQSIPNEPSLHMWIQKKDGITDNTFFWESYILGSHKKSQLLILKLQMDEIDSVLVN